MEVYQIQIIETIIVIIIVSILRLLSKKIISKVGSKFKYQSGRIKITNKIVGFLLTIILAILFTPLSIIKQKKRPGNELFS